jgi:hypothetical protein
MPAPSNPKLNTIDLVMLTPLVGRSLYRPEAVVIDWKYDILHGGSANSEIYRFSGNARDRGETLPWSLVLKIIHSPDGADDPNSLGYFKREALAYQTGLLDGLPGIICAPRCFGIDEQSSSEVWLWLEEIVDEHSESWTVEQYGNAARALGQFNGSYLEKQALISQPWLAKGRLRAWVDTAAPSIPPDVLAHPMVRRGWPDDIYEWMQQVWSRHEAWISAIERQPQTLSHLDAFRRNLFVRRDKQGNRQTVLIDWAMVGSAAPGEEIAPLVAASLNFLDIDIARVKELDQVVFEGYLEGLHEVGWHGDSRLLRSTYVASSILRYCIGVSGVASMVADENQRSLLEQIFSHPLEELVEVWGRTNRFLFHLADEVNL